MNWKYLVLRIFRKIGLLTYSNLVFSTKINEVTFRIPIIQGIGLDHFHPTEKWMTILIDKLLALKQGQFIDVGVNIGQTLLKLQSTNREVKYVGFEPNPKCVYYVSELVRLNAFKYVTIIPCGVYSFDGVAKLFFNKHDTIDSCATLIKDFRIIKDQEGVMVPVISKGSLGFLEGEISIIKIDVEGAEVEVIEQFVDIIKTKRPFIVCEILPAYSRENNFRIERHERIELLFKELNYKIAQLGNQFIQLDSIPINNTVEDSNYLFYPVENEKVLNLKIKE